MYTVNVEYVSGPRCSLYIGCCFVFTVLGLLALYTTTQSRGPGHCSWSGDMPLLFQPLCLVTPTEKSAITGISPSGNMPLLFEPLCSVTLTGDSTFLLQAICLYSLLFQPLCLVTLTDSATALAFHLRAVVLKNRGAGTLRGSLRGFQMDF